MTITNDVLALVFFVGLTIVYVPQYYKIIKMTSSKGFSPWFLFLGYSASFLSCVNSIIYYLKSLLDCSRGWDCMEKSYGFTLLCLQWLLFLIFYVLFLVYFDNTPEPNNNNNNISLTDSSVPAISTSVSNNVSRKSRWIQCFKKTFVATTKGTVLIHFLIAQIVGLTALIFTLVLLHDNDWNSNTSNDMNQNNVVVELRTGSKVMEVGTMIMFCLHYVPQILETIYLKNVGSLSLVTLGILCPGTFLWTYFLATQNSITGNGDKSDDLSIWLPYLATGILQLILLIIGIYYEIRDRRMKKSRQYLLLLDNNDLSTEYDNHVNVF